MPGIDAFDPFRPWFNSHPDMDRSDERRAVEEMMVREELTQQFLAGQTDIETLWDCLAQQGIDPLEWTEATVNQVERVIDQGIVFESDESGLFLPIH